MRGEKRKVPRLRVLVQAMRAKNAMTKRSRSYRARREAASKLWCVWKLVPVSHNS